MNVNQSSWDRLRNLLEELAPGDEVDVPAIAQRTGLDNRTCAMVLSALARAELFTQTSEEVFVRRRSLINC